MDNIKSEVIFKKNNMPEIEQIPTPGKQIPPMSSEDVIKQEAYRKGKKIVMKDGTIRIVHSRQEELEAITEDREKEYNV